MEYRQVQSSTSPLPSWVPHIEKASHPSSLQSPHHTGSSSALACNSSSKSHHPISRSLCQPCQLPVAIWSSAAHQPFLIPRAYCPPKLQLSIIMVFLSCRSES